MYNYHKDTESYLSIIAAIFLIIIAVIGGIIAYKYFTDKSEWKGLVSSKRWHYEQDVLVWAAVRDQCWTYESGCMPDGSYDIDIRSEYHHSQKIGEICSDIIDNKGKKTGESCMPIMQSVYKDRAHYTINKWVTNYTVSSDGTMNTPFYADLAITRPYGEGDCDLRLIMTGSNSPMLGCQTPGGQRQQYWYDIKSYDPIEMAAECSTDFNGWESYKREELLSGEYWTHQNIIDCAKVNRVN